MNFYDRFVDFYNHLLGYVPTSLQWLVTLLLLVGLIYLFLHLIKSSWIFIIVLIVLLPAFAPIVQHVLVDAYNFGLFLLQALKLTAPKTP